MRYGNLHWQEINKDTLWRMCLNTPVTHINKGSHLKEGIIFFDS